MSQFPFVRETRQWQEIFVFVGYLIHTEEFLCRPGIFANQISEFFKESQRSECDIFFVSDGSGDEVEHRGL